MALATNSSAAEKLGFFDGTELANSADAMKAFAYGSFAYSGSASSFLYVGTAPFFS